MARRKINYYVFTPGVANAGTVKMMSNFTLDDILMITNVTKNIVIYNFGDPNRGGTVSFNPGTDSSFPEAQNGITTLTLKFDTSTHSASDVLQIYVESMEQRIRTHDFGIDAVERQRIAMPRSMIDADFEYGLQSTKWFGYTTWRNVPATYPMDGTDFNANTFGYVTMISGNYLQGTAGNLTAAATPNTVASLWLLNQGNAYAISGSATVGTITPGSNQVHTAPIHYGNDYKLIIRQEQGLNPNSPGVVTTMSNVRPISLGNGGQFQRSFTVSSTTGFAAGDVIAVVGLPTNDATLQLNAAAGAGPVQVAATVSSLGAPAAGVSILTANATPTAYAGAMLAVEAGALGSGTYELMTMQSSGTTAFNVVRNIMGTNSANAAINAGARIFVLGKDTAIETMRIDSIDSATQLSVTRGWFGANANAQFAAGSIVAKVNLVGNVSANVEIVKTDNTAVLANIHAGTGATGVWGHYRPLAVLRQFAHSGIPGHGFGTYSLSNATAGSLVVNLTGMFVAGNTQMPMVVVNANSHGILKSDFANSNAFVSTLGTTGYLNNANVEGIFMNQINDATYFAYFPKSVENRPVGYPLLSNDIATRFKKASPFQGANLTIGNAYIITSNAGTPSLITVTTATPHGVLPGLPIQVTLRGASSTVTNADTHGSGLFVVNSVASDTVFTYIAKAGAAIANTPMKANITVFPTSVVKHRPVDGGTNIGINAPTWGFEATRQTKKYFRYQSGKGMMFTTGTQFNPVFSIANIVANATTVGTGAMTVTTYNEHGLQRGANVTMYNISTSGYNDYYYVNDVVTPTKFTLMNKNVLGSANPAFMGNGLIDNKTEPRIVVTNWVGGKVRSGMFDDANGVFFEYDGTNFWAVKRSGTNNLVGSINVAVGENLVTGDANTRFQDTLDIGDEIQIRGQTHTIISITSQNVMYISPAYRGSLNAFNAPVTLIREQRVRQADFTLDKLDGTGPSGYILNLSKMQMVGIQYTWYGAGFIDYGMRTKDGQMIWAHRIKNNNVNDEGYMRSGNLPARYQAVNRGAIDQLAVALTATETNSLQVYRIKEFPTPISASYPVVIMVDQEMISYTGRTAFAANTGGNLTGLTRSVRYQPYILGEKRDLTGSAAAAHAQGQHVEVFGITASPDLNHWGSAVILDGGFDVDRTYSFTYQIQNITVTGQNPYTLFMVRLAPSIGSGLPGDLGVKDVINRAQLLLQNCYINVAASTMRCQLQGVVNPVNIAAANWQNLNSQATFNQPSFSQFVANVGSPAFGNAQVSWSSEIISGVAQTRTWAAGGEQLFSIPVTQTNSGFLDLSAVKEIGGTLVPGAGVFPNGPEVVAFNIVPISATFNSAIDLQLTWIESQA